MRQRGGSTIRRQGVYGAMWTMPAIHQHIEGVEVFASKFGYKFRRDVVECQAEQRCGFETRSENNCLRDL